MPEDRFADYVDVAERSAAFFAKYPRGRLQPRLPWRVAEVGGQLFIVYEAAAYRNAEDPLPGIGTAWEPFPGRTPFTKDSELQNAETAAWGRAMAAVGITASRRLATRQEIENRNGAHQQPAPAPVQAPPAPQQELCATCGHLRGDHKSSGSRALNRDAPGFCTVEACTCRLYQPPAAKPAAQTRTMTGASEPQRRKIHALISEKQVTRPVLAGLLEPHGVQLSEGWMDRLSRGRGGTASLLIEALNQVPTPPAPVQGELGASG